MRVSRWMLLPVAILLAAPPPERAQQPPASPTDSAAVGSILGEVYDSLARAALEGANVRVQGSALSAVTDRRGRFRLDSVPAGRRVLVLDHPGLDSAGVGDVPRVVNVVPGATAGSCTGPCGMPRAGTGWSGRW